MKTVALITAAGYGRRMGRPKQFIEINGRPILGWTLAVFEQTEIIDEIVLVVNQEDIERAKGFKFSKLKMIIAGGKERQDSVYNGLKALSPETRMVAIHDGARPLVTPKIIEAAVLTAKRDGAVVVGVPLKDTVKKIHNSKAKIQISGTLNRDEIWAAQTPQVFKKDIIVKAYEAGKGKHRATDDAMLVEKIGNPVTMVMGAYENIKITTPADLVIAGTFLTKERLNESIN